MPVTKRPVVTRVALSTASFAPSDTRPAVLSFVAGRVDGSPERPQLLPLKLLDVELYRGARRVGRLARLRDVLPGRYAFGLTGRGPLGARLRPGAYARPRGRDARWAEGRRHASTSASGSAVALGLQLESARRARSATQHMSATETPTHLRENPFALARRSSPASGRRSVSTRT